MNTPTHPAYEVPRAVTGFASVVLCHNPGAMELEGTNTWILRAPGVDGCVVVDPGPADAPAHTAAVTAACSTDGGRVEALLVTHRHHDHTGGLDALAARTGAPVRAWSSDFCRGAAPLRDREVVQAAGLRITVLHTPGHTADSISLLVEHQPPASKHTPHLAAPPERALLTGDTVLGRGTTVLDPADGSLAQYMDSLNLLIDQGRDGVMLPGHGPERPDVVAVAREYRRHREQRLVEIRRALDELGLPPTAADPMAVVAKVYADVDRALWAAARMSVEAQLDYLAGR
ncbi:MBL fold metallo-hydrolase [Georgenia yuyongxinii]|uniref:MBL fold metallo-hydrolase n=1 Tax=Georgenia yuyongxinii TaxID=2589797 RepID=A0A5B8BYT3_9MICO|nr:MBL fold metallo-hydrolase [Georgenia yuyongxinii]QDC23579.1 MBL fold metallo-hydrolase [Georgenia yuyongxinii]